MEQAWPTKRINLWERVARRSGLYLFDLKNIIRYGRSAPRFAERVWIDPRSCKKVLSPRVIMELCSVSTQRNASGLVIESPWPSENVKAVTEIPKITFCIEHWVNGVPWEDTGVYEYMERKIEKHKEKGKKPPDDCENIEEVRRRYKYLDRVFEQVKSESRMRTMGEINPNNFREYMGPCIHFGPDGEPYFAMRGSHRFAIAYILDLPLPAQIGCVHLSAIPYLHGYRQIPLRLIT